MGKKIIIGLALIAISAALFAQNLTFVSNQITYEMYGKSGTVNKESIIKIYDHKTVIFQGNDETPLTHMSDFSVSNDERYGGVTTMMVMCKDDADVIWLLGISKIKELNQFTVTIYREDDNGVSMVMFFGAFKESIEEKKNTLLTNQ